MNQRTIGERSFTTGYRSSLGYDTFVNACNEAREHGGINGLPPLEKFLQTLITSAVPTGTKQRNVTHVGNQICNLFV
jgi:hypothetical protein